MYDQGENGDLETDKHDIWTVLEVYCVCGGGSNDKLGKYLTITMYTAM